MSTPTGPNVPSPPGHGTPDDGVNGHALGKGLIKASTKGALCKGQGSDRWVADPKVRCFDIQATATFLGVSRRAVWRLVERGTLRPIRLQGLRKVLIDRLEIERVIDEGKLS